tara:strand:+ start:670 stop:1353 length:684 start_codon:yes stop_codon:yes gene_type:complete
VIYYLKLIIKFFAGLFKLRYVESLQTYPILKSKIFSTIYKAQKFDDTISVRKFVIDKFENQQPIDFIEFGVHRGISLKQFSTKLLHKDNTFTGFDSFHGLPEVYNHPSLEKGVFSTDGEIPKNDDNRVKFVKGYFNEIKDEIIEVSEKSKNTKLVHFDADIYSSTLYVLFALDNYTPYYAVFDQFGGDEARALYSYLISTDKKIDILATSYEDKFNISPQVTFMKIY